jgi:hemoglobin
MNEETEITIETPAPIEDTAETTEQSAAEEPETEVSASAESVAVSLREQLGGDEAIQNAVEVLTDKLMSDPRINYFLFGVSRADQGEAHKSFLTVALKGAEGEEIPDLRKSFDHFFERGFKDRHFDLIFDHLRDTLRQMQLADDLSEAVLEASNTLRKSLFLR